jgi:chromate transporter
MRGAAGEAAAPRALPGLSRQLWIWTGIGLQSFGGGQATRQLVYRQFVEVGGWISPLEYAQAWAVCQMAPGMSLVALVALIGRRIAGPAGMAVALAGLLLPSTLVTVLITEIYLALRGVALVGAAMHGVVSAVLGIALVNAVQVARPLLQESRRRGGLSLVVSCLLILVAAVLVALNAVPVAVVLASVGAASALWTWAGSRTR